MPGGPRAVGNRILGYAKRWWRRRGRPGKAVVSKIWPGRLQSRYFILYYSVDALAGLCRDTISFNRFLIRWLSL